MDCNTFDLTVLLESIKSETDADNCIVQLKEQLEFYKRNNAKCDQILSKLKRNPESLSLTARDALDKFAKLEEAAGVQKFDVFDLGFSYLQTAKEKCTYERQIRKVQGQHEYVSKIIENVDKDTSIVEREIDNAKQRINTLLPTSQMELEKINLQIKSYEDTFSQLIYQYPWLNEPEFNLLRILEEIKNINHLKEKISNLESECEYYSGLKPDIHEAKIQLSKIKKICTSHRMEVVPENNFYSCHQNSAPQTKMEIIPGGVSYTFSSTIATPPSNEIRSFQHVHQPQMNIDKCSLTIQQQVAIKQLELQQLQNILLQEQSSKGYVIFHNDKKLSTTDIPKLSKKNSESTCTSSSYTSTSSESTDDIPEKVVKKTNIGVESQSKKKSVLLKEPKSSKREKNDKHQEIEINSMKCKK